jgi:hypothetical protein
MTLPPVMEFGRLHMADVSGGTGRNVLSRSSLELTALSLVETVLPVGLGLLAGWWASPPFVSAIVGDGGVGPRPLDVVLLGGVVLATVGVASAADALARHRRTAGRTVVSASRVPWRSAVLALAGAGAISAYRGGTEFDAVTAAFPLAAVGAVAIVVSTVATALLGRLVRRWLPRRLGPRLTVSRLARDPASSAAFLAATVAFGAAGYGLLVHASADDATTDKIATTIGANSVFGVDDPVAAEALADDTGRSTVVLRTIPRINGFTGDRLFAVDSATFEEAALWSPRFAGRDLIGRAADDRLGRYRGAAYQRRYARRTQRRRAFLAAPLRKLRVRQPGSGESPLHSALPARLGRIAGERSGDHPRRGNAAGNLPVARRIALVEVELSLNCGIVGIRVSVVAQHQEQIEVRAHHVRKPRCGIIAVVTDAGREGEPHSSRLTLGRRGDEGGVGRQHRRFAVQQHAIIVALGWLQVIQGDGIHERRVFR